MHWRLALLLGCLLPLVLSQTPLKTTGSGSLQGSGDDSTNDFLAEVNKQLENKLDPEVLEDLEEWNQDILSKLNLQEAADGEYGSLARDNPLGFLSLVSTMPKEEQLQFLKNLGADIQQQTGQACNMYGGKDSCMTLPANSDFAKLCPEHDLKVDCAYYSEDIQEVQANPIADMKAALQAASEADLEDACPECFENQRRVFCFTALPKCGSFSAQVETALLPAAEAVVAAQKEGQSTLAALAIASPHLSKAMSLALPCKEMCTALLDTCSCGKTQTFGELMKAQATAIPGVQVPDGFSEEILGLLQNKTVCDLYISSTTPGFVGHCEVLPKQCSNQPKWCSKVTNPVPSLSQRVLAQQNMDFWYSILRSWTPDGVSDMADVAENPDVKALEEKYIWAGQPPPQQAAKSGMLVGVLVGVIVTAVVFAGVSAAVFLVLQRRRRPGQNQPQYVAMTESDSLLQPPTAEL